MNTERIKNMIIIFLTILNAVLFALIYIYSNQYTLSAEQEQAIINILSNNDINISADIPRKFTPQKPINMHYYSINVNETVSSFFDAEDEVTTIENWDDKKVSIHSGEKILTIESDILIRFENPAGYRTESFVQNGYESESARLKLSDEYLKKIKPEGIEFSLNTIEHDEDYYVYDYRGNHKGNTIYSNFIRIRISENGVVVVRCYYSGIPKNYDKYSKQIFSPDESLFLLMKQLKVVYNGIDVDIKNIDIVYNTERENISTDENIFSKAVPCYKIDVAINNTMITFLVDAYTNTIIK